MTRYLENYVWLLLVALAIALTAACSGNTTSEDAGSPSEDAPASMTGG